MNAGWLARWLWGPWSRLGLGVAAATLVLDQADKLYMLEIYRIAEKGRVAVLPFLDYVFVLNRGISYGLLTQDGPLAQWLLAGFAVAASLGLTVWLARGVDSRLLATGVGLIIGGAIGNAIDRVRLGGVADFYALHAFGYSWYVFNVADVAIVAGVIALLYESFIASRNRAANNP